MGEVAWIIIANTKIFCKNGKNSLTLSLPPADYLEAVGSHKFLLPERLHPGTEKKDNVYEMKTRVKGRWHKIKEEYINEMNTAKIAARLKWRINKNLGRN